VHRRWGVLDLLDVLKEADFDAGFTEELASVASQEVTDRTVLRRRLLLVLFGLGTNVGIRHVVGGYGGETEAMLRRVRRLFVNRDNLRRAITRLVNATFAVRDVAWWGEGTACVGLQEVRIVVLELHDGVSRPLWGRRGHDLLARGAVRVSPGETQVAQMGQVCGSSSSGSLIQARAGIVGAWGGSAEAVGVRSVGRVGDPLALVPDGGSEVVCGGCDSTELGLRSARATWALRSPASTVVGVTPRLEPATNVATM
jgi:hypothetical protein